LKSEVADKLSDLNVSNFAMTPVKVSKRKSTIKGSYSHMLSDFYLSEANLLYLACLRGTMPLRELIYQMGNSMS
jgi:hypothetical protein